ncbi:MAG: extensin family protein [Hyphomicrobiales bacterium]
MTAIRIVQQEPVVVRATLFAVLSALGLIVSAGLAEAETMRPTPRPAPSTTAATPDDREAGVPLPPRRPDGTAREHGLPDAGTENPMAPKAEDGTDFSPDNLPDDPAPVGVELSEGCEATLRRVARAAPLEPIRTGECIVEAPYDIVGAGTKPSVALVPSATLTCPMTIALANWLDGPVQEAARDLLDRTVSGIWVAASFDCRGRNNDADAKLSEHGRANAIDVSALVLDDGSVVSVERDWAGDVTRATFLHRIHAAACGPFTTVIGPDGDEYHRNHFHFDLAERGKATVYRICE